MLRRTEKHSARCERIRVRAERSREPSELPPAIGTTYSRPNSSTEIDAFRAFSRRSSRHLCRYRLMHAWLEPRKSATVPRALTCVPDARPRFSASHRDVPDARPRSAHLTEDGHTHDTRPHVSAYARRGVAMPLGGAQLRSRRDTPRRAPVPAPAPLGPRLPRTAGDEPALFSSAFAGALAWLLSGRRVSPLPR